MSDKILLSLSREDILHLLDNCTHAALTKQPSEVFTIKNNKIEAVLMTALES